MRWKVLKPRKPKKNTMLMLIFIVLVDDGLSAQNWSEDEYDLYESHYPLQEQKRSVQRDIRL